MESLQGHVALVTGASQGIGRACAVTLANAGATVALAARNEEKLKEAVAQIEGEGGKAAAFRLDARIVRQRNVFDLTFEKFDILDTGLALVFAGEREHLIRHIQPVSLAGRRNTPRRQQNVETAARSEIKDYFTRSELRQCSWIATS